MPSPNARTGSTSNLLGHLSAKSSGAAEADSKMTKASSDSAAKTKTTVPPPPKSSPLTLNHKSRKPPIFSVPFKGNSSS